MQDTNTKIFGVSLSMSIFSINFSLVFKEFERIQIYFTLVFTRISLLLHTTTNYQLLAFA